MLPYVAGRLVYALVVMVIASIVIFAALRVSPGQPEDTLFNPLASEQSKNAVRDQFHLDDPIYKQYGIFVGDALHGDLGTSIKTGEPITDLLREYGGRSLELVAAALFLTYVIAIPLGVAVSRRPNSRFDHAVMAAANLGMSIPNFLLALILIRVFAIELGLLPLSGYGGVQYLVLPAVVLAAEGVALTVRLVRSSMLEQLGQDYIRTLRAEGLSERAIVWRHALRNAILPVISLFGLQAGAMIGYTAIVEIVFRWPGLGQLMVDSVLQRDYPVALAISLVFTFAVIVANFLANVGYAIADPRVRTGGRAA